MAAPFVSGLAELLFAQDPSRSASDVKALLATTSDKVGGGAYGSDPYGVCSACSFSSGFGYGRVSVVNALTGATQVAPKPDFAVAASPSSLAVLRGKSGTATISATALNGFSGSIAPKASGLPSGVSASFSSSAISPTTTSTLTLTVSTSAAYGTYPVTVTGTSGSLTRTTTLTLTVPAPDFAVKASPASAAISQTESAKFSISLANLNGFASTVSLSASGVPAGATASWSKTSVSGTTAVTLTVATTTSTPAGQFSLTINGVSGSLARSTPVTLTAAVALPTFTLALTPTSSTVGFGKSTSISYTLTVTPKFGWKGAVTLTASGLPGGASGAFKASTLTVSSTSAVAGSYTLKLLGTTPRGSYPITFTASGASVSQSAVATLTIS
jgi:hypothetical protein